MKMKKFIALALATCMSFSMITSAFAADGTQANPEVLTKLDGDITTIVTGGKNVMDEIEWDWTQKEYEGYYYSYTVPEDVVGTVQYQFSVDEDSPFCTMNIKNLETEMEADINSEYEMYSASINAKSGDEIQIKIMSKPTITEQYEGEGDYEVLVSSTYVYPDLTLTWSVEGKTVGTAENPEAIDQFYEQPSNMEVMVTPGTDGYYYSFKNEWGGGVFAIYIDENGTVDPHGMYPNMFEDDPVLADSMAELKPEIILTNKTTNEVVKYSDGTEVYTITNRLTGRTDTYNIIQIPYKQGEEIVINFSSGATGYADGVKMVCGLFNFEPFGTYSNPYKLFAQSTTAEIAAYEAYFIKVNGAYAQFPISVTGDGEFVVKDMFTDEEYTNTDNIELVKNEDTSEYGFYIFNMTENDATYSVKVNIPVGNELNPEVLETNKESEVTFKADDTSMYYYTWTAKEDGIVKFNVTSDFAWKYSVDNKTTGYSGLFVCSSDKNIVHEAIDVSKGDELIVYVMASNADGEVTKDTKVKVTAEFTAITGGIVDTDVVDKIVSDITDEKYEAGSKVELDMNDATVVPAEVLKAIIEYNELLVADGEKPLSLVIEMGSCSWTITDVTSATPIDLGITFDKVATDNKIIEKLADGNKTITFNIAHNGDFGFDAVLDLSVSKDYAGKTVALYLDDNGTLKLVGEKCVVTADGSVKFAMTHASDYVMVIEGTKTVVPPVDNPPVVNPDKTGDMAPVAMLLVVAVAAAVVVLKKRETAEN